MRQELFLILSRLSQVCLVNKSMKVAFASDHGGRGLRLFLQERAGANGYTVVDLGTESDASVDYPDFAKIGCEAVLSGRADCCVLICGTGIGISIAANKMKGIRCALCSSEYDAEMARKHNNANALALGGRTTGPEVASSILLRFLATEFEGGRHATRLEKIKAMEE